MFVGIAWWLPAALGLPAIFLQAKKDLAAAGKRQAKSPFKARSLLGAGGKLAGKKRGREAGQGLNHEVGCGCLLAVGAMEVQEGSARSQTCLIFWLSYLAIAPQLSHCSAACRSARSVLWWQLRWWGRGLGSPCHLSHVFHARNASCQRPATSLR